MKWTLDKIKETISFNGLFIISYPAGINISLFPKNISSYITRVCWKNETETRHFWSIRNVYRHGLWVSWNYVSNYYIINLLRANYVHVLYMLILINFWAFDHKGIFSHAFRSLIVFFFVSLTLPWPRGQNAFNR